MNKRQAKKLKNKSLIEFGKIKKDEIMIVKFNHMEVSPEIMSRFVELWTKEVL